MRRMFSESKIRDIAKEESSKISVNPGILLDNMHGSDNVIVDLDEDNSAVEIRLDEIFVNGTQVKLMPDDTITMEDDGHIGVNVDNLSEYFIAVAKPDADGTYVLKCQVHEGHVIYSWVKEE